MNWLTRIIDKLLTDSDAECPTCGGDGIVEVTDMKSPPLLPDVVGLVKCPSCNGTGRVTHERRAALLAEAAKEGWK